MSAILIASHDKAATATLSRAFDPLERIDRLTEWDAIVEAVVLHRYDFVFLDLRLEASDYKARIKELLGIAPALQVIVVATQDQFRQVMLAIKEGARDYVTFPIAVEEVRLVTDNVDEAVKLESELNFLRDEFSRTESMEEIRSDSLAMQAVFCKVQSVAPTRSTVL